jgi:hypothetical protein
MESPRRRKKMEFFFGLGGPQQVQNMDSPSET